MTRWDRPGPPAGRGPAVLRRLTLLAVALRDSGPSRDFRDRLRRDLTAPRPASTPRDLAGASRPEPGLPNPPARPRCGRAVVALCFSAVLVLTCIVSSRSLPGDPLYDLKLAAERSLAALTTSDYVKAERALLSARSRAQEAMALLGHQGADREQLITRTLGDMDSQTRTAVHVFLTIQDRRMLAALDRFACEQQERLTSLLPLLPEHTRATAVSSLALVKDIRAQVRPELQALIPRVATPAERKPYPKRTQPCCRYDELPGSGVKLPRLPIIGVPGAAPYGG